MKYVATLFLSFLSSLALNGQCEYSIVDVQIYENGFLLEDYNEFGLTVTDGLEVEDYYCGVFNVDITGPQVIISGVAGSDLIPLENSVTFVVRDANVGVTSITIPAGAVIDRLFILDTLCFSEDIPTMGQWGLLILGMMFTNIGLITIKNCEYV